MKQKSYKPVLALALCLAMCIVCIIGCSLTLTSGGNVEINDLNLLLPTGETLRVLEYRPSSASNANKVPAVVISHGNDCTAETLQEYALELSRRGIAVYAPDITSAGRSSLATSSDTIGFGIYDLVDYIYYTLDYIDTSRIGITGYSKGANNVYDTMNAYGEEQRTMPDTYVQRVSSAFLMAPRWGSLENFSTGINIGIDLGLFDPYSRMNFAAVVGFFAGDLSVKSEVKECINAILPGTFTESEISDPSVKISIGVPYGSYADGTGIVIYNAATSTHASGSHNPDFIRECTEFFCDTLDVDTSISSANQVWYVHFFFAALGLITLLFMLEPLTVLLARTRAFESLTCPVNEPATELCTVKDKLIFVIVTLVVSFTGPVIGPTIFANAGKLFKLGDTTGVSRFFILGSTANNTLSLTVVITVVNLLVLLLFYYAIHRKNGVRLSALTAKLTWLNAAKAIAVACLAFIGCYIIICFADSVFHVDFRLISDDFQVVTVSKLFAIMRYAPFYIAFWVVNSLIMNGLNRFKGMKEWTNTLLCIGCNIIGMVIMCIAYGITMFTTGAGFGSPSVWKIYMCMLYMIFNVSIGTIVNRRIYLETGNIYLGATVYGVVITFVSYSTYMFPDFVF